LIICPMDQWPGKASEKASSFKDRYTSVNENGNILIEYIQCFSLP
jgi:nuclear pore complex protein Nup98-Nup96